MCLHSIEEMQVTKPRPYKRNARTHSKKQIEQIANSIRRFGFRYPNDGKVQRLTIRTFLPTIIVDEISVIEEQSPVLGRGRFDETARKRMFAYMLSGKDDSSVVASEKKAIVAARLNAQVALIDDLLAPLEQQLQATPTDQTEDSIEKIDETIARVSDELAAIQTERATLLNERDTASDVRTKAETQILAIDQLLTRYHLLSEHYTSDLSRLDCQSALNFGPVSASNFDPLRAASFERLVGAGRDCGDETGAGGVIVVSAFEPPTVVTGFDDVAVVGQSVEQRGGHLGVAEHAGTAATFPTRTRKLECLTHPNYLSWAVSSGTA